jgi:hypothetical protein
MSTLPRISPVAGLRARRASGVEVSLKVVLI